MPYCLISHVPSCRAIYGRDERVTLFTRAMDDGDIFYFLFISPNDEYRDYSRTFERMLRSLRINDAAMHR